jgi:hypothetical protein
MGDVYLNRRAQRVAGVWLCRKCGRIFPRTLANFHGNATVKDGMNKECRACVKARRHSEWQRKAKRLREAAAAV